MVIVAVVVVAGMLAAMLETAAIPSGPVAAPIPHAPAPDGPPSRPADRRSRCSHLDEPLVPEIRGRR